MRQGEGYTLKKAKGQWATSYPCPQGSVSFCQDFALSSDISVPFQHPRVPARPSLASCCFPLCCLAGRMTKFCLKACFVLCLASHQKLCPGHSALSPFCPHKGFQVTDQNQTLGLPGNASPSYGCPKVGIVPGLLTSTLEKELSRLI